MKKIFIPFIVVAVVSLVATLPSCTESDKVKEWNLVWEDEFEGNIFDNAVWSKIPRGHSDWDDQMDLNDACFEMRNGNLVLKGIPNPNVENDTIEYITGGLYTKGKKAFHRGRLEIKAKLQGARGAWPAFWLMPFDTVNNQWPYGGEIDIMERLNNDTIAYQTIHSHYTKNLGIKDNPPYYATGKINPNDYNVYTVEMHPDSLVFYINENRTFCYPRIETDKEGQYPFDKPFYLLIDMQLGGEWVGPVHMEDLPVEMEIDWVRFYQKD
ncbi:MAG: glycoside hydrolase family 16 protein [Bacteroidaceae bacterium]|nr:glycoside hydrolase family 16 protein [Bacteroidaceae bacterium]